MTFEDAKEVFQQLFRNCFLSRNSTNIRPFQMTKLIDEFCFLSKIRADTHGNFLQYANSES